jgi:hypothetical protein
LNESSFYAWKRTIAKRDEVAGVQTCAPQDSTQRKRTGKRVSSKDRRKGNAKLPDRLDDGQGVFVPVTVIDQLGAEAPLEIVAPDGWQVRVRRGFDVKMLTDVLGALQAVGQSDVAIAGREVA